MTDSLVPKAARSTGIPDVFRPIRRGRPEFPYDRDIADAICIGLSEGRPLFEICQQPGYPSDFTVRTWALQNRDGFASRYAHARDLGLDRLAEEVLHCHTMAVDQVSAVAARIRFDAMRWYLSKLAPKRYGEATQIRLADADGEKLTFTVVDSADAVAKRVARKELSTESTPLS